MLASHRAAEGARGLALLERLAVPSPRPPAPHARAAFGRGPPDAGERGYLYFQTHLDPLNQLNLFNIFNNFSYLPNS